jgi:hypothetical protein
VPGGRSGSGAISGRSVEEAQLTQELRLVNVSAVGGKVPQYIRSGEERLQIGRFVFLSLQVCFLAAPLHLVLPRGRHSPLMNPPTLHHCGEIYAVDIQGQEPHGSTVPLPFLFCAS